MNWLLIGEIGYILILALVCLRIIYDTRSTTKTVAYLLFAVFLPFIGMIFYFSFGINYRKRKMYNKKLSGNVLFLENLKKNSLVYTEESLHQDIPAMQDNSELAHLLIKDLDSPLTKRNRVKLLLNGENKFPEVIQALREAKHHIHIEYYIYENDVIGGEIEQILIAKAKEGVEIRFIYDDFGSRSIRRKMVKRMRDAGIQTSAFHKIRIIFLANRLNYRNHRKIIIIDGKTAFTGGINVSDKYINSKKGQVYWRDTHLRIDGPGVYYLQYLFLCDWIFCCEEKLSPDKYLTLCPSDDNTLVQIAASGPDSPQPSILFSMLQVIYLAKEEILITTPYFIPGDSLFDALIVAALSGLKVRLLVPGKADSLLVNAAARSYYQDLLEAGVEIFRYEKGFVHAKTMVADGKLSVVGTANMDYRSFDLNFEVNALIYDSRFGEQLRQVFYEDIKDARKMDLKAWKDRPIYLVLGEKVARLLSPLL